MEATTNEQGEPLSPEDYAKFLKEIIPQAAAQSDRVLGSIADANTLKAVCLMLSYRRKQRAAEKQAHRMEVLWSAHSVLLWNSIISSDERIESASSRGMIVYFRMNGDTLVVCERPGKPDVFGSPPPWNNLEDGGEALSNPLD